MKLNPEDPRLSSYLLGELSPDEAAEVERALAADAALRVAMEEIGETQRILGDSLGGEQHQLHGWQREAVRRAARDAEAAGKVIDLPSGRRSLRPLIVVAAAAVVTFGLGWLMWQLPIRGGDKTADRPAVPDWGDPKVEIALLPLPGPAGEEWSGEGAVAGTGRAELVKAQKAALRDDPLGFLERIGSTLHQAPLPPARRLPVQIERRPVDASKTPLQPLPVIAGEVSWHWLRAAVLDEGRLPPPAAVRVGELINAFPYSAANTLDCAGVGLSTESGPCPWDESAQLVLVTIKGATEGPRRVAAEFVADPAVVDSYRLLGFGAGGDAAGREFTTIPANHRVSLMLQVWPSGEGAASPGRVGLRVALGESDEEFRLPLAPATEWSGCSGDFRHAALIAGCGLWLSGSEVTPVPDPELLARLAAAEKASSGQLDDRRAAGLRVILSAAAVAGK